MAKLNIEAFSGEFKKTAPKECAMYLYECLTIPEKEKLKEDWEKAGGVNSTPWWKWCMEHIEVNIVK